MDESPSNNYGHRNAKEKCQPHVPFIHKRVVMMEAMEIWILKRISAIYKLKQVYTNITAATEQKHSRHSFAICNTMHIINAVGSYSAQCKHVPVLILRFY